MGEWQPIETAPKEDTILVADLFAEAIAVSHYLRGWSLGPVGIRHPDRLEFEAHWWLPFDFKGNPFKVPLPALTQGSGSNRVTPE